MIRPVTVLALLTKRNFCRRAGFGLGAAAPAAACRSTVAEMAMAQPSLRVRGSSTR